MTKTLYLKRKNLGNDIDAFVLAFEDIPSDGTKFLIRLSPEDEIKIGGTKSKKRPLIGLLLALDNAFKGYTMDEPYLKALLISGAEIAFIHYDNVIDQIKEQKLDGILLPGGWFPFPKSHYKNPEKLPQDHELSKRSLAYLDIIEYNKSAKLPLLGICGGFQMLANSYGTKMAVSIKDEINTIIEHVYDKRKDAHKISIIPNTKLAEIAGQKRISGVNSIHYEGVFDNTKELKKDIVVSAYSEDGLIEAVELPDFDYAIGVQWHPEYLMDRDDFAKNIYVSFVEAAKKYKENKNDNK